MSQRHDILIVGGGLVGPALALALAEVGFDVAIVDQVAPERRAAPDFDGRAYAVALGSSRLLDTIGIWEAVAEKAEPGANVLCMLPDTGERYLSTPLFDGIPEDMTEDEVDISRSTPNYRFDSAPPPPPKDADEAPP